MNKCGSMAPSNEALHWRFSIHTKTTNHSYTKLLRASSPPPKRKVPTEGKSKLHQGSQRAPDGSMGTAFQFREELVDGNMCVEQTTYGELYRNWCAFWQGADAHQAMASGASEGNIQRGRKRTSADSHSKTQIMHVSREKSRCMLASRHGAAVGGSRPLRIHQVLSACNAIFVTSSGQACSNRTCKPTEADAKTTFRSLVSRTWTATPVVSRTV